VFKKRQRARSFVIIELTNGGYFHRFKIGVELKKSGKEWYGDRKIFGVDEESGFEKEGEKGGIGKVTKIL